MILSLTHSRNPVETLPGTNGAVRMACRAAVPFGNLTAFAGAPER